MDLKPDEFPFRIVQPLAQLLPSSILVSSLFQRGQGRGLHESDAVRWLVAGEDTLGEILPVLQDLYEEVSGSRNATMAAHAAHLRMQISTTTWHYMFGFRPGVCAPWGVTGSKYRVHAARLRRDEVEPFRLIADSSICRGAMKSLASVLPLEPITCAKCQDRMATAPKVYPLAVSRSGEKV